MQEQIKGIPRTGEIGRDLQLVVAALIRSHSCDVRSELDRQLPSHRNFLKLPLTDERYIHFPEAHLVQRQKALQNTGSLIGEREDHPPLISLASHRWPALTRSVMRSQAP